MLIQGQSRLWKPSSDLSVPVRVCGIGQTPQAVIGVNYICELLRPIPDYHYTHILAFECHLHELDVDYFNTI